MKKYISIILAVALALFFVSCEKQSAGVTKITYYPVFVLNGDNPMIVPIGTAFTDPGFTATLEGVDITSEVTVDSNVDDSAMGVYSVSYSAVNKDGYSYTATRTVLVANPGNIDNIYSAFSKMGARQYDGCTTVITYDTANGYYVIDDLCGGYYYYGRYPGYEPTYNFHAKAAFVVNTDNSLSLAAAWGWYFAGSFDYTNFTGAYNPTTGVISYDFDGLAVVLTPIA